MFVSKTEAALQKKKSRLNKITSELINPVQTAYLIGQDSNKSEYWVQIPLVCQLLIALWKQSCFTVNQVVFM